MNCRVVHGSSESGLCSTCCWPNLIKCSLSSTCCRLRTWSDQVVQTSSWFWVGRSESRSEIPAKSQWDFARSGRNLTWFNEISLDLDEISLDLLDKLPKYEILLPESGNLKSESGNLRPKSERSHRNLENLAGIWKFPPEFGNLLLEIY